jgi:hypothetical protein
LSKIDFHHTFLSLNLPGKPERLRKERTKAAKNISMLVTFSSMVLILSACGQVKVPGGAKGGGDSQASSQSSSAKQGAGKANPEEASKNGMLNGDWRLGFKYNGQTFNASMSLKQRGNSFTGTGKEDETGNEFEIKEGIVRGDQLQFTKKYIGKNASMAPIQYAGTVTTANEQNYQGPYLSGDYSFTQKDGQQMSSEWDAVQDSGAQQAQAPQAPRQEEAPPPQAQAPIEPSQNTIRPDHPPDLSGKWNVGFEYQFKTIHSVMFLEQDHEKITGHGVDDTKEKFVIEKGTYKFPNLTLTRKYPKGETVKVKGKTHEGKPERTMTFKADVSVLNDKDYQGAYLSGKTEGGGAWEAELYK